VTIINEIAKTVRPTDLYFGSARVVDGNVEYDIEDLTPSIKDLPAGIEVQLLQCDLHAPYIAVDFIYLDVHYRGVWLWAGDLQYVAGNNSTHLDGECKVCEHRIGVA